jgi:hypothetical protein
MSISSGLAPAISSARAPAWVEMDVRDSPAPRILRCRMPVRELIHSSLVSTSCPKSSLVITLAGTHDPTPTSLQPTDAATELRPDPCALCAHARRCTPTGARRVRQCIGVWVAKERRGGCTRGCDYNALISHTFAHGHANEYSTPNNARLDTQHISTRRKTTKTTHSFLFAVSDHHTGLVRSAEYTPSTVTDL